MASPVASSYSVAAGQPIYAGRVRSGFVGGAGLARTVAGGLLVPNASAFGAGAGLAPTVAGGGLTGLVVPTWAVGQAIGEVRAISGTAWPYSAGIIDAWGTLPVVPPATLVSPANGGHSDSSDNGVYSIDLSQNSPTWTTRIAASAVGDRTPDVNYYADGKPVSRHGYQFAHYIAQRDRVMLFGARARHATASDGYAVAGHSVSGTWTWDAAGTYPDILGSSGFGIFHDPLTGNVWTNGGRLWTQATNTWSVPGTYTGTTRFGGPFDTLRERFTAFQVADGQSVDFDARTFFGEIVDRTTGARTAITWASDTETVAAIAEINASSSGGGGNPPPTPNYASSVYDQANDKFWLYYGHTSNSTMARRIYRITPQSGGTGWTMERITMTGTIALSLGPGINGRLRYIHSLGGIAIMPSAASGLYFYRTV